MKKIILLLTFILTTYLSFGQTVPVDTLTFIPNEYFKPAGTKKAVYDISPLVTLVNNAATSTQLTATNTTVTNNNKAINSRVDSCSNALKNLPISGGGTAGYKFRNISSSNYTLQLSDSSQTLFFTSSLSNVIVTVPTMSIPIMVKLIRSTSKTVTIAPGSGLLLNSVGSPMYRRIQGYSSADIFYNTTTTANLCGQITK